MYFEGGVIREQNALAKSLLGNMTGVREAVPAQGPEAEAGGSCCTLPAVHTHPFSPAPPTRAGNTGFQQKKSTNKVISLSMRYKLPYSAGLGQHLRTIYHLVARKAL